jgi:MarR family transcriptional regulator, organic hydroperoxide resistance regulator
MSNSYAQQAGSGKNNRDKLVDELQFLGQMSSTETALFHHTVAMKMGVTVTDIKTVSTIMQEGPMTAGQLAERLSLTSGAVTSVIDRLEKADFVVRKADPNDRRKVIVTLNEKKLRVSGTPYDSIGIAFKKLLSHYSDSELQFLVDFYKASIEITKQEIAKAVKL